MSIGQFESYGRKSTATSDGHGRLVVEQVIEQRAKAGHGQVQVFANLTAHGGGLRDEVSPMSCSELQFPVRGFQFEVAQSETGDGRSMLSVEIGSVGLIAGIGRHAVLLGREGMNDPGIESSLGKNPLGGKMVVPRPFYNHDHVLNVVSLLRFTNLRHRQLEESRLVFQGLTFDE